MLYIYILIYNIIESTPSEAGLRLDAQATLDWLNNRKGKFTN
jgi:hypothetical protein